MEPLSGYWLLSQFPPPLMLMVSGTGISSDYFLLKCGFIISDIMVD